MTVVRTNHAICIAKINKASHMTRENTIVQGAKLNLLTAPNKFLQWVKVKKTIIATLEGINIIDQI